MLQEEPESKSYGTGQYTTNLGHGKKESSGRHLESMDTKFFVDNKSWILKEVENFLEIN